jgi:hypothetical protein
MNNFGGHTIEEIGSAVDVADDVKPLGFISVPGQGQMDNLPMVKNAIPAPAAYRRISPTSKQAQR